MNTKNVFFQDSVINNYSRSDKIKDMINESFEALKNSSCRGYLFCGSDSYSFWVYGNAIKIDTKSLLKEKVNDPNVTTPIQVLDVGAGDFSFCEYNLKKYKGKILAYGIAANDVFRRPEEQIKDEYHRFENAEYLSEVYGENQFDFIFTRATYMHFVDPVGSIQEAYKTLKPGGVLVIDEFFINGCEGYTRALIEFWENEGYLVVAKDGNDTIKNLILQKPKNGSKPDLLFPVEFSHCKDKKVFYKPNHCLMLLKDNQKKQEIFYSDGAQNILDKAKLINQKLLESCDSLPELFSNETYAKLGLAEQHLFILAIIAKTVSYDLLTEKMETCEENEPNQKGCFKSLCQEIGNPEKGSRTLDNGYLYRLANDENFKLYEDTTEGLKQQLRLIEISAMAEIIRYGKIINSKQKLDEMGIPCNIGFPYPDTLKETLMSDLLYKKLPFSQVSDCLGLILKN